MKGETYREDMVSIGVIQCELRMSYARMNLWADFHVCGLWWHENNWNSWN